jgi:RNA polymerase sigma-70 factor (ECF subfamily)
MNPDLPTTSALPVPLREEAAVDGRAAILARLRERIVAFAASRYAGAHAEDLAQEVLVLIHEKYGHLDRVEDLMPLAFQILRFKLAAHRRKAFRRGEYDAVDVDVFPPVSDAPDPATVLERKELLAKLMGGIARMGERCRELFRLKPSTPGTIAAGSSCSKPWAGAGKDRPEGGRRETDGGRQALGWLRHGDPLRGGAPEAVCRGPGAAGTV